MVCPIEGFMGRALMRTALRFRFVNHHMRCIIVVLAEGNRTHPQFSRCNMFVPWEALNGRHPVMAMCTEG